jgi:PIN domain nuclease of toxin-antitoxin system
VKELFLVTDTHPLLWYIGKQDRKLSKKVLAAFKSAHEGTGTYIWVPAPVVWEISLLMKRTNRFSTIGTLEGLVKHNFFARSIATMDLQMEDILYAHSLDFNKDPFDALIVGTAQRMDLPLITADADMTRARVCPVFW